MKCECGSTTFEGKMVTVARADITTEYENITYALGTEDTDTIDHFGPFKCKECGKSHYFLTDPPAPSDGEHTCGCGCTYFFCLQHTSNDIVVDGSENFVANVSAMTGGGDTVTSPFGPYQCVACGKSYDDFDDIPIFEEDEAAVEEGIEQ